MAGIPFIAELGKAMGSCRVDLFNLALEPLHLERRNALCLFLVVTQLLYLHSSCTQHSATTGGQRGMAGAHGGGAENAGGTHVARLRVRAELRLRLTCGWD